MLACFDVGCRRRFARWRGYRRLRRWFRHWLRYLRLRNRSRCHRWQNERGWLQLLQADTAERLLRAYGKATPSPNRKAESRNAGNGDAGPVNGQLPAVSSMDTRRGKSLFTSILVNTKALKLFSEEKEMKSRVLHGTLVWVITRLTASPTWKKCCQLATVQGREANGFAALIPHRP